MRLYYVYNADDGYRLVVYATCEHDAKRKASYWVLKNRYRYVSDNSWNAVECHNSIMIE